MQYLADHPVDANTQRDVEELLAHDTTDENHMAQPIARAARAWLLRDVSGARCGAFRLVSVIGRGGMGVVYLADRVDGEVTQRAAVKLMHPGWSEVDRERFLQEREILAALTHPNIAHLLDAGHLEDGQPYLAMEYVEGKPIDQYCTGFSARQKIELFLKVCGAVEYLHRNQVVHRDLKPSNILLPALGEPKLLDFGIAKMLEPGGDLTATHLRKLTPNYASPEQVRGGAVGTNSDIYSLGAVLHTLLTGRPPQEARPSQLAQELKGDLEIILQTALRQEPQERYASVKEFADDLKRYLESRPIRARQAERMYRARKFARRHWLATALAGATISAVLSAGALVWYWSRPASTIKNLRPVRLTANTPELTIQAAAISPNGMLIAYSDPLGIHIRDTVGGETRLLPGTNGHVLVRWLPDGAGLQTYAQDANRATMSMVVPLSGGPPAPASNSDLFVGAPDRKHRATASADHQRLLLQDTDGENSRELWTAPAKSQLNTFQWSPNSKQIGVFSSNERYATLETIDVASGQKKVLVPAEKKLVISSMVWPSQDRIILAIYERVGSNAYNTNLWEVHLNAAGALSGELHKLTAWTDFPIRPKSLSTDGKRLVFVRSFAQRDVYIADMDAGHSHLTPPRRLTMELGDDYPTAWTPDSKTVILASDRNGSMAIFRQGINRPTAEPLVVLPGTQILPRVTPDGKSVLLCSIEGAQHSCKVMRVPFGGGTPEVVSKLDNLVDFRCSPAGPCFITQLQDQMDAIFELDVVKGKGREIYRGVGTHTGSLDISPDGKWLAEVSRTKIILRSFVTGAVVQEIPVHGVTNLYTLNFAPDGKGFFSGDRSPTESRLLYVDLSGKLTVLWRQAGAEQIWGVPSPDGRHLAMMMYTDDANVYMVENF